MGNSVVKHSREFYKMISYTTRASQADAAGFKSFIRELES